MLVASIVSFLAMFPLARIQPLPEVAVTADDTRIDKSCRIVIAEGAVIADANGDGVIHIVSDDITVDFRGSVLRGAGAATPPDQMTGVGIRISGHSNVRVRNLDVRGYKVALQATAANGLLIDRAKFSDNYRQRLLSTPKAEDSRDWLSPHYNDQNEWISRYGAAISVEDSREVTIRRVEVRRGQNGIALDRVQASRVYNNDCSFLSGWGLALWRNSDNVISRNAFDFCIRGYSHGVYNRGQDSAGILMFEQCHRNVIAENSVTHGGDGFFGFAGREALGEGTVPEGFDHTRVGNNDNILIRNDFSYAAAHGIELTFSFGNQIVMNRVVGNAICGVWGGYSHDTFIAGNRFDRNGEAGYGLERGGVNIEHSVNNVIHDNKFVENECGVHLWWDPDEALTKTPWARANGTGCEKNRISFNGFNRDKVAIHLRETRETDVADNQMNEVGTEILHDEKSKPKVRTGSSLGWTLPTFDIHGRYKPVGKRGQLEGREHIIMTEWGPWDHESPLVRVTPRGREVEYQAFGVVVAPTLLEGDEGVSLRVEEGSRSVIRIIARRPGVHRYRLALAGDGFRREYAGVVLSADWKLTVFPWTIDPRKDLEGWRAESAKGQTTQVSVLDLPYAMGGPRDLKLGEEITTAGPPPDRFGTVARTTVPLAAGRYRLVTLSDDGIRVTADGKAVIEDWTWHGPTRHEGVLTVDRAREVELEVEHFEIDGYAVLMSEIEPLD